MNITGRRRASLASAIVACGVALLVSQAPSVADAARTHPISLTTFMTGLACVESGGRFDAVNPSSGAYGKYQIMPRNWPVWAARYLRNRWARPSPRNQEFVVSQRILGLYERHGSWRVVAHWWLTGNAYADEALWSTHASRYVDKVMRVARRAATPAFAGGVPQRCFPADLPPPEIRTEPFPKIRVAGGSVNVRRGPGYERRALGVVRRDMRLPVLASADDVRGQPWLRIGLSDGTTGWIAARYARPD